MQCDALPRCFATETAAAAGLYEPAVRQQAQAGGQSGTDQDLRTVAEVKGSSNWRAGFHPHGDCFDSVLRNQFEPHAWRLAIARHYGDAAAVDVDGQACGVE